MEVTQRIVTAALALFLQQGVKRTSLEKVAFRAGVTRITVYRHFGNKRGLVRAVCRQIAAIFQRAAEEGPAGSVGVIQARLETLAAELRRLPPGNLLACFEEISRVHPEVYDEFRQMRQAAIDAVFEQALATAAREGTLRPGLNAEVLRTVFWSAVVGLIENPMLISANVPLSEIVSTVTAVFRHGILIEQPFTSERGQAHFSPSEGRT
jgi:AcrR family transcriptional regulator